MKKITIIGIAIITIITINILSINNIKAKHKMDVSISNIKSGSNGKITIDENNISYNTTLNKPGEYYEFSFDVTNNNEYDILLNNITKKDNDITELSFKYKNGKNININDVIKSKQTIKYIVRVEYKNISKEDIKLDTSFGLEYVER